MAIGNITPSSVHEPTAMGSLSIRGRGKKENHISMREIEDFAKIKGVTFVRAYRYLTSKLYKES